MREVSIAKLEPVVGGGGVSAYDNAFWGSTTLNFGDGDGHTGSSLTTIDIAGHELSHGPTEYTVGSSLYGSGST